MLETPSKSIHNLGAHKASMKIYQIFAQRRPMTSVGLDCCDVDDCDRGGETPRSILPTL